MVSYTIKRLDGSSLTWLAVDGQSVSVAQCWEEWPEPRHPEMFPGMQLRRSRESYPGSRKLRQGRFKVEACVNVVGIVLVRSVDDIFVYHTTLHSNVLESWWMEYLEELGDILNGDLVPELVAYHECV